MTAWTWPAGRLLILYHWSWYEPAVGDVIVGWSPQREADSAGYVHLEAEQTRPHETVHVYADGNVLVKAHLFSAMTPLPSALCSADGTPLPWIVTLLTA